MVICYTPVGNWGFPGGSVVKNAANTRDAGLIPGSGRPPGGGNGNLSRILAWKIPWTEDLADYSSWGHKESDMTEYSYTNGSTNVPALSILYSQKKKVRLYSWYLNNAGVKSANPPQSLKPTYNLLMKIINKQSIIGIEKNFIWAKLKTMPRKHRFKKQLNCVLLNYKMGAGGFYFIKTKLTKLC